MATEGSHWKIIKDNGRPAFVLFSRMVRLPAKPPATTPALDQLITVIDGPLQGEIVNGTVEGVSYAVLSFPLVRALILEGSLTLEDLQRSRDHSIYVEIQLSALVRRTRNPGTSRLHLYVSPLITRGIMFIDGHGERYKIKKK